MVLLTAYLCYVIHVAVVYSLQSMPPRIKPTEVLQRHASGNVFGLLQFFFRGNTSDQSWNVWKDLVLPERFLLSFCRWVRPQHGRYSHLSGCLCDLHRFLLRHHTDADQMLTVVLTATLASHGTAGVPGAGMVMLAMVLTSVGLPVDGIALVAGVDRIFDMDVQLSIHRRCQLLYCCIQS